MTLCDNLFHPCILAQNCTPAQLFEHAQKSAPLPMGQYAYAWQDGDETHLVRDPLGLNKLFWGRRDDGQVIAASRVDDALELGIDLDNLASVPPGHGVAVKGDGTVKTMGYDLSTAPEQDAFDLAAFQSNVRTKLEAYFDQLPHRFPNSSFVVCLSGGLDSTAVASLAASRLPNVSAACFSYASSDVLAGNWKIPDAHTQDLPDLSDDYNSASAVAAQLGIPLFPVLRPPEATISAIGNSVRLCQDWRDFNVHCAIVNLFLAQDIRARFPKGNAVVLTGDLMNEFVCDYREETIDGTTYYPQPRVSSGQRRRFFVRGLDAGDREIGVFNAYGIPVVQPFAAIADEYMKVPSSMLEADDAKQTLNGHLVHNSACNEVSQVKRRAQVGGKDGGTLGLCHRAGLTQDILREIWTSQLPAKRRGVNPTDIIQFGRYRTAPRGDT